MSISSSPLKVLCVIGSSSRFSETHAVMGDVVALLQSLGCEVDVLNPHLEPLQLFNPETAFTSPGFLPLKQRVDQADAFVFATPDYHGSISSTLKNFFDHFWKEFAGKLFATVVGSHEKGLTVLDQVQTISRQCNAWSLPYGVSFASQVDIKEGKIASETLQKRVSMLAHDIQAYGTLLREQRRTDLAGTAPGFLARLRKGP